MRGPAGRKARRFFVSRNNNPEVYSVRGLGRPTGIKPVITVPQTAVLSLHHGRHNVIELYCHCRNSVPDNDNFGTTTLNFLLHCFFGLDRYGGPLKLENH